MNKNTFNQLTWCACNLIKAHMTTVISCAEFCSHPISFYIPATNILKDTRQSVTSTGSTF